MLLPVQLLRMHLAVGLLLVVDIASVQRKRKVLRLVRRPRELLRPGRLLLERPMWRHRFFMRNAIQRNL